MLRRSRELVSASKPHSITLAQYRCCVIYLRWTRWPRRSTRRARSRWLRRGPCWRSGGASCSRGRSDPADLAARAREWAARRGAPRLRRVLNATGVIVHTNLGRAPLAASARAAVARAAEGYSNLELDLETGERGSRHDHVEAAAVLADRRGGGDRGQQLRRRDAAGGGGAGRAWPRGDRLARAAGGDRRRVPGAGGDRAGGRAAGRGRHHEPDATRRLRARDRRRHRARSCAPTRRTSASSGSCRRSRSRSCASSACR